MVDFQSRDTRRGLGSDDEEEEDAGEASEEERASLGEGESAEAGSDGDAAGDDGIAVLATGGADTDARDAVVDALESAGYRIYGSERRARDHDRIQTAVDDFVDRSDVCAVVTVGGTGVGPDDDTVDAVGALFSKHLPGFGEAFRRQWASETDEPGVSSRVTAGLADDTPVFCLPGTQEAATLGARELVAPDAASIHRTASGY